MQYSRHLGKARAPGFFSVANTSQDIVAGDWTRDLNDARRGRTTTYHGTL